MMRSAWLKWARGVEHQKVLAAETRQRDTSRVYEYSRMDNLRAPDDPLGRIQWRLRVIEPYPERWSVLIGDVVMNLRDALDHAFWAAVNAHSGTPERPDLVNFPICATKPRFKRQAHLESFVEPAIWDVVKDNQPFPGGDIAHTSPLEILRQLSNHDKHRTVQVVGSNFVGAITPIEIASDVPIDIVEQWHKEGLAKDGDVVARLKFKRPVGSREIVVTPVMSYMASLRISDTPEEYRDIASLMDAMREAVFHILVAFNEILGEGAPKDLYLGEEHDAIAPDGAGHQVTIRHEDGTVVRHRIPETD
jgi:hypothetical protein